MWRGNNFSMPRTISALTLPTSLTIQPAFRLDKNDLVNGTIVCTGTGVIAERQHALQAGDEVEIVISKIGRLVNPVRKLA